jgi:hypothetical protein
VGAEVLCDGLPVGTTPTVVKVVQGDNTRECLARKDGFNDYPFKLNPLQQDITVMTFNLVKPPKGTAVIRQKPPEKKDQGSGVTVPRDKTGGELTGDPYAGSGTVPKK